jgi:hypothetical protein
MANRHNRIQNRGVWLALKKQVPVAVLTILILFALGLIGHRDEETELFNATISTCEQSYQVTNGALEQHCGDLIDEVQQSSNVEVLSNHKGRFWIEYK